MIFYLNPYMIPDSIDHEIDYTNILASVFRGSQDFLIDERRSRQWI